MGKKYGTEQRKHKAQRIRLKEHEKVIKNESGHVRTEEEKTEKGHSRTTGGECELSCCGSIDELMKG